MLVVENLFACSVLREQLFHVLLQDMQVRVLNIYVFISNVDKVQMVSFQPDMMMSMLSTGCRCDMI